ncbi:exodeoxyribonuclease V subunit alpha, partial [Shigella sonnei]|nr:exodeoxyribonuclease V subunit alpha [Shigella sonnei]
QALGIDEAAFVAALPVQDEAATAAIHVAHPASAAARARAPAPAAAATPKPASRRKVDERQASLFDDEPQEDEVSPTSVAPPPVAGPVPTE